MDDRKRGLYGKFNVQRNDGKSEPGKKHHDCEYFVLDLTHDPYALHCIRLYASLCKKKYPALSLDLMNMADEIEKD